MPDTAHQTPPEGWDRRGLPGWCYHSPALLQLEQEDLFKTHWQIACHVSDIPDPGSFITFDLCGERAIVLRGDDGGVKAFHNICRHRGSRLVAEDRGVCRNAMICPFHGWVYNLDGTLRGPADPQGPPPRRIKPSVTVSARGTEPRSVNGR